MMFGNFGFLGASLMIPFFPFFKMVITFFEIFFSILYFLIIFSASEKVVLSAYVKPEDIELRSSPITSDNTKEIPVPGIFSTNFPPLISERCFLTHEISLIFAPH